MKELCREVKPRNTDPSGSTSCSTWQEKCNRKKKSCFQSCFFDVPGENDPFYKKDGTSLFSTVKRKYPFRDISMQLMAGGMWPVFHGGRSVQWSSQVNLAQVPSQLKKPNWVQCEQVRTRATLQITLESFSQVACLCFGVFLVFLNFWRMDSAVLLLPALALFDVSLKACALKAYKTKIFFFLSHFMYPFNMF